MCQNTRTSASCLLQAGIFPYGSRIVSSHCTEIWFGVFHKAPDLATSATVLELFSVPELQCILVCEAEWHHSKMNGCQFPVIFTDRGSFRGSAIISDRWTLVCQILYHTTRYPQERIRKWRKWKAHFWRKYLQIFKIAEEYWHTAYNNRDHIQRSPLRKKLT